MKKLTGYLAGLIGLYVIVAHGTGFGTAVTKGASGASTVVKTLQGR